MKTDHKTGFPIFEPKLESIFSRSDCYDILLASNKTKQQNLGQFHTQNEIIDVVLGSLPNDYCERLLNGASLIDPSCGTGNFLISVLKGVLELLTRDLSEIEAFEQINSRVIPNIVGAEIDPLLVTAANLNIRNAFAGQLTVPKIISIDSLDLETNEAFQRFGKKFDYVVGNPPWVEAKRLPDAVKDSVQLKYSVSNLYGAFLLQGARFLKPEGFLSFVVPRSFTGGRYYFKLRAFLANSTSIRTISYFTNRNQEFQGGRFYKSSS